MRLIHHQESHHELQSDKLAEEAPKHSDGWPVHCQNCEDGEYASPLLTLQRLCQEERDCRSVG